MDELKLNKWRQSFEREVENLQIEYDAFLLPTKFGDTYELITDDTKQMLSLKLDTKILPTEIQNRLSELLMKTEPEDSI